MVKVTKVDVLAFGAHPDDVEVGAGGLVARFVKLGLKVAIVDITAGEMSTNGTPEEREEEAQRAGAILGVTWRNCLGIADRGIVLSKSNLLQIVEIMRAYQPKLILCPYWEDRHPDHINTAKLVQEAHFDAGLGKVLTNNPAFRPAQVWHYFVSRASEPKFIVDISEHYSIKKSAALAHQTQFGNHLSFRETFLNAGPGSLLSLIESRDRYFGSLIGCTYGEGFTTTTPLALDPMTLLGVAQR